MSFEHCDELTAGAQTLITPSPYWRRLIVLALVFVPQLRLYALVLLVWRGVGVGLLLYRSNSRRSTDVRLRSSSDASTARARLVLRIQDHALTRRRHHDPAAGY